MLFESVKMNKELNSDEKLALTYMLDRMKSSKSSKQFFDKKVGDSFILFTMDEMQAILNLKSKTTVAKVYAHLEKLGLIIRKRTFNGSKIFIPKFDALTELDVSSENDVSESTESDTAKVQKMNSNHSHLNQKIKHSLITSDTADAKETTVEKWRTSVIGSTKLPELAVDAVLKYTHNDLKKSYKIIGLVHKAKNAVVVANNLKGKKFIKYESNANIRSHLGARLMHLFTYAGSKRNEFAYIMACLKTFFLEAFGLVKDELERPVAESKQQHKDLRPQWMKDGSAHKVEPFNKEYYDTMIAKADASLRRLRAK